MSLTSVLGAQKSNLMLRWALFVKSATPDQLWNIQIKYLKQMSETHETIQT